MPIRTLQRDHTLLVEGPASIRLERGDAYCLGAPVPNAPWTVIREERQLPFETEGEAMVEVRLGHGGKLTDVDGSTFPTGWREASQITWQSPGTVAILGDVDSGKSTLCTLLANESYRRGLKATIIDADIGQADIGPPATISSANVAHAIFSLQDMNPEMSLFMGDTSPSFIREKLTRGVQRLKEASSPADVLIINTDGWVRDEEALGYKLQLLDTIKPDLVLGIESDGELSQLLEAQRATTLRLMRSSYARTRTKEERKRAREYGYRRFMLNARSFEIDLRNVKLRRFNAYQQLKLREDQNLRGVLAGFLDKDEVLQSIARVKGLRNGVLSATAVVEAQPSIIELGSVLLSASFEELGYES